MSANSNSWDLPGLNFRSGPPINNIGNSNYIGTSFYGNPTMRNTNFRKVQAAPPLPPRPNYNDNIYSNYSPQGSHFNNFGYGSYSSYGGGYGYGYRYRPGYSPYNYGFGPNAYYGGNSSESRFIQFAEESSRPAFQMIQSLVQAFNSVATMFDSTFHAIYSSYMSVLGVADNFGKIRSFFSQLLSTLAIVRTLRWIYRKFLYLIGINDNPQAEAVWMEALMKSNGENVENVGNNRPTWLIMLFLSVITAGPYLLFKLMNHLFPYPIREEWNPSVDPGSLAVGMYNFQASSDQELTFCAQQKLMIAPEKYQPVNCPGWLLACNESKKIGLIPNNYIGMIMQSEKTGKTYIEHNGQTIEPSASVLATGWHKGESENNGASSNGIGNPEIGAVQDPEAKSERPEGGRK